MLCTRNHVGSAAIQQSQNKERTARFGRPGWQGPSLSPPPPPPASSSTNRMPDNEGISPRESPPVTFTFYATFRTRSCLLSRLLSRHVPSHPVPSRRTPLFAARYEYPRMQSFYRCIIDICSTNENKDVVASLSKLLY